MRDLTLILKNTRNSIFPFKVEKKIQEQTEKAFEVEIEYGIEAIVSGAGLNLELEIGSNEIGSEPVYFESKITFKGSKTFEVYGKDENAVRKQFDASGKKFIDLSLYSGQDYLTEGFSIEVEDAKVKVIRVEELPE